MKKLARLLRMNKMHELICGSMGFLVSMAIADGGRDDNADYEF